MGGEAARDVRGRRARSAVRPARLRGGRAGALRRPPLGARRRGRSDRRQLAGAGREAVLHSHAAGSSARHAPPSLPGAGSQAARHRRRDARRLDARRRERRRLPPRGARPQPRHPHARHRRDDPGRPVPPDHPCAGPAARDPGRPRNGQDRRRAPSGVVADLHRARTQRPESRARRRAEPHVHGIRLARPAGARRGQRRAARGLGPRQGRRRRPASIRSRSRG